MFGYKSKRVSDEVLNHWIASADDFTLSPNEFYEAVEKKLAELKTPGLEISREEYEEGGILSDKRVYLRMIRERMAFDVCAAQFGTRYFFSSRTVYSPATVKLWHIIVVLFFFYAIFYGLSQYFAHLMLPVIIDVGLMVTMVLMFRNVALMGLHDVDAMLLKIPAIGPIYERFFRKDTYFRQVTRLMYLDTVPNLVQKLAEDFTGAKGVKLVRQYQVAPILGKLYKPLKPRKDKPKDGSGNAK